MPNTFEFRLPELGENIDFGELVAISVAKGDKITKGQTVCEVETDKAVVEVPSPVGGEILKVAVQAGKKINVGELIALIKTDEVIEKGEAKKGTPKIAGTSLSVSTGAMGPAARRASRARPISRPLPDFSRWGPIERKAVPSIRLKIADNVSEAWKAPHVTQFDEADINDLESWRKDNNRVSLTAMIVRVSSEALEQFSDFNSSYDSEKGEIIYKKYYHIGVAVDTERGLMVPVVHDADKKDIFEVSREIKSLAERARASKITLQELEGSTFTVTNLGGLGTTHFTPILHWPDVAILGVGRASIKAAFKGEKMSPRLILPLSISYDHRAIDGAGAARFLRWVCERLERGGPL